MKKIILSLICIFIAVLMVGCSSSSDAKALKELETQLSKTESVVSSTSTSEVSEVSPKLNYNNDENQINSLRNRAYNDMVLEENLRQEILSLSAYLKDSQVNNKYKLAKKAATSLNELTSNLEKYTNSLNDTKNDVKSSVSRIKKYTDVSSVSPYQAVSGYTSLANTMNERNAYMNNILVTLEEITNLLNNNIANNNATQNSTTQMSEQSQTENFNYYNNYYKPYNPNQNSNVENGNSLINNNVDYNRNTQNNTLTNYNDLNKNQNTSNPQTVNSNDDKPVKKYKPLIKKNIDSYNPYSKENITNENQNINNTNNTNNNNVNNNSNLNNNTNNNYNNGYNYNNNYTGNPGNRNYNNLRYNRINPNRNTDTYRANFSNIDTYRYYPNRYKGNFAAPVSFNEEEKQDIHEKINPQIVPNDTDNDKTDNNKNQVIQTLPIKDNNKETKDDNRKEINKNLETDSSLTFNLFKPSHKGRKIDKDEIDKKDIEDKFGHMKEIVILYNANY